MPTKVSLIYGPDCRSSIELWVEGPHAAVGHVLDGLMGLHNNGQPIQKVEIYPNVDPPELDKEVALSLKTVAKDGETVEQFISRHMSKMDVDLRSWREHLTDHPEIRQMTVTDAVKAGNITLP